MTLRFYLDEDVAWPVLAAALRALGHDVECAAEVRRGTKDPTWLEQVETERLVITNDRAQSRKVGERAIIARRKLRYVGLNANSLSPAMQTAVLLLHHDELVRRAGERGRLLQVVVTRQGLKDARLGGRKR